MFKESPSIIVNGKPKARIHHESAVKSQYKSTLRATISSQFEYHHSLLKAFGITNSDIEETISDSEEPFEYRSMFKFLDFYARLSDTKYKVSNDEINKYVNYLRPRMLDVVDFYETEAKDSGDIEEEESLLKISQKAKQLSKPIGDTRLDKVIYIDSVASFEHTHGSILPVVFGISDHGSADYWPRKLLDYLRNNKK